MLNFCESQTSTSILLRRYSITLRFRKMKIIYITKFWTNKLQNYIMFVIKNIVTTAYTINRILRLNQT